MNRYELSAAPDAPPAPLRRFLQDALPLLPPPAIREALAHRDVRINDVRARDGDTVPPGARVTLYTPYAISLPIIFEDDCVLVINKPAGLSAVADALSERTGGQTLFSLAQEYVRSKGENVFACHRLDNPTSGLIIFAKNEPSRDALLNAFRDRTIDKRYQCLVKGCPEPESALCEAFLLKDAEQARVRVLTHHVPGALPIATRYRVMSSGDPSRLEIELLTGRTHQIRAHMAFMGYPLLGDDKYGDRAYNRRMHATKLKLCACSLTLHTKGCLEYLNNHQFVIAPGF